MLGVSAEHSFLLMLEDATNSNKYCQNFQIVLNQGSINRQINSFRNEISKISNDLSSVIKDGLGTNLDGILILIKTFRNDSGHPTGNLISEEQLFILLNLFVPYCKKIYQLREFFQNN
jgi:hypothetical protein